MALHFDPCAFVYAHRGLWRPAGPVENTLAAFRAAAAAGLGIEFDVRPDKDGRIIVFHDENLKRLADSPDRIEELTLADLERVTIGAAGQVPSFAALLEMWPKDLPLLTEMKIDGQTNPAAFARDVAAALTNFDGLAAAMSFSEAAVRALPDTLMRGQLVQPSRTTSRDAFEAVISRALEDGIEYISIHVSDTAYVRHLVPESYPVVTWTVRTKTEIGQALRARAAIIFEHLDPALVSDRAMP